MLLKYIHLQSLGTTNTLTNMKQLVIILILLCSITDASLCENYSELSAEQLTPIAKSYNKPSYVIETSNEYITISSLATGSQVWIFDSSGRSICNKTVKNETITIPIRSRGVFIIRVKLDKKISTTKVLIN